MLAGWSLIALLILVAITAVLATVLTIVLWLRFGPLGILVLAVFLLGAALVAGGALTSLGTA